MICPVIAAYVKVLDERMPPPMRVELDKYRPLVSESAGNFGVRRLRAYIAADYAVRDATASAMFLRGHDPNPLEDMPPIVDYQTALDAAKLAADVSSTDEAVYASWSAFIAAYLVAETKPGMLPVAADAAGYAYYLAAAATSEPFSTQAWEGALDCLERMLEVR